MGRGGMMGIWMSFWEDEWSMEDCGYWNESDMITWCILYIARIN